MCGICGIVSEKNIIKDYQLIKKMGKALSHRGPDDTGYYACRKALLGHTRLAIIDIDSGIQPMKYKKYTLVYNGELYNTEEIRKDLIDLGYKFDGYSDTEVVLKGFACYGTRLFDKLNGIFAFGIYDTKKLYIVRDRVGVKPLFYSKIDDEFVFSSEIKSLLQHPKIEPVVDLRGLQEILGLGPSQTPGVCPFKQINELKPGHYIVYENNEVHEYQYWALKPKVNKDTYKQAVARVRKLVEDAITRQLVSDVGVCTFLSGGIDSSIITGVAARKYKEMGKELNTYSIDYEDNNLFFKENTYEVDRDKKYIKKVSDKYSTNHNYLIIKQQQVAELLQDSLYARDLPGMVDIDSSLLWLCKKIQKDFKVALSGECADEIFCGYPWFYNNEYQDIETFPWLRYTKEKEKLLQDKIKDKLKLTEYVHKAYKDIVASTPKRKNATNKQIKEDQLTYINMTHFMYTLLTRKDRMSMYTSLEVRVPFSDHRLIEYLFNIPFEYKYRNGKEKKILRDAFKDLLPKSVLERKKNPYPKTHNPVYTELVCNLLKERLKNKDNILLKLFKSEEIYDIIESKGSSIEKPFFGQLMSGPQFLAFLYQFDLWVEQYEIRFEL